MNFIKPIFGKFRLPPGGHRTHDSLECIQWISFPVTTSTQTKKNKKQTSFFRSTSSISEATKGDDFEATTGQKRCWDFFSFLLPSATAETVKVRFCLRRTAFSPENPRLPEPATGHRQKWELTAHEATASQPLSKSPRRRGKAVRRQNVYEQLGHQDELTAAGIQDSV